MKHPSQSGLRDKLKVSQETLGTIEQERGLSETLGYRLLEDAVSDWEFPSGYRGLVPLRRRREGESHPRFGIWQAPQFRALAERQATLPHISPVEMIQELRQGNAEKFFAALTLDPTILTIPNVFRLTIGTWWRQKHLDNVTGDRARQLLKKIGSVLADPAGRPELSPEEREAIIASCQQWLPRYKGLNTAFKILWKQDHYHTSELYKKEKRGELAEKYKIPVAEVKALESYLGGPPPIRKKRTPTQAMYHRVAYDFPGRGEQTVKNIWEKYVRDHPEWGRKRRKLLPS